MGSSDTIAGDIVNNWRMKQGDIRMENSPTRGGISFFTPSFIDILAENETITIAQRDYAQTWHGIQEIAFAFQYASNTLWQGYSDYEIENIEAIAHAINCTADDALQLFLLVSRSLSPLHLRAVNACCQPIGKASPMTIFWAFQEHTLTAAFESLERKLPEARQELNSRIEAMQKKGLQ